MPERSETVKFPQLKQRATGRKTPDLLLSALEPIHSSAVNGSDPIKTMALISWQSGNIAIGNDVNIGIAPRNHISRKTRTKR